MSTNEETKNNLQDQLDHITAQVTKQGSAVRQLKKENGSAEEIKEAISKLQALKLNANKLSDEVDAANGGSANDFNRAMFDDVIIRKMFVVPSFEIHGGIKGLFDLGPPGCAVKAAMIDLWRKHFVLTENMLEMECTCLTPEVVLKTSGHVERFTDLMVKDPVTAECFRADKLLEDAIDEHLEKNATTLSTEQKDDHLRIQRQADAFTPTELDVLLLKYECFAPSSTPDKKQPYSNSFPFNLMFKTHIGPEGTSVGYLRPETAQGLFVNFKRLLDLNASKMPFAAAQIGLGFRNEIAPRSGLLRVREFCMAEIEHFVNPNDKSHPNFKNIADKELVLFNADDQLGSGKTKLLTVGEAVKTSLINNETLGYFMARTQLYMEKIGMDPKRLRFRQHLKTEMAHYAADCWDLEIKSSYGWVECVGHADRACYDLDVHGKATKTPMIATVRVDPPRTIQIAKLKFDRKELGKSFKQKQRVVSSTLDALADDWTTFEPIALALEKDGKTTITAGDCEGEQFEITKEMLTWKKTDKKVHEVKFTPSVIEPSFGIGRVLYSLLEHSFYQREGDEQRTVMRFNPIVAPQKCAVLPISTHDGCNAVVDELAAELIGSDLATRVDKSSAALGRRYARADELGVPFAVTVDFQTLEDGTVTLRERDSTQQIRFNKSEVTTTIFALAHMRLTWEDLKAKYPLVQVADDGAAAAAPASTGATKIVANTRATFSRPSQDIIKK